MHITIRRYKADSPEEVARASNEGFVPLISKIAGSVAYYAIETGKDSWTSVSVFETPAGAEESNRVEIQACTQGGYIERTGGVYGRAL